MSRSNFSVGTERLEERHLADLKMAASKMLGPARRAFEAEMVGKYCAGNAWWGEHVFGWSRHTIALGLAATTDGRKSMRRRLRRYARWRSRMPSRIRAFAVRSPTRG